MAKRAVALVCVMVLLLLLTACGSSTTESPNTTTTTSSEAAITTTTSGDSTDVTPPQTGPFTVLTEGVEADDIRYYKGTENYPFCVIEKNEKYGLIDYRGELVVPMTYSWIGFSETYPGSAEVKLNGYDGDGDDFWFEADGTTIEEDNGLSWGYTDGCTVCWYQDEPVLIYWGGDDYISEFSHDEYEYWTTPMRCPGTVITETQWIVPVQEIIETEVSEYDAQTKMATAYSEKYALLDVRSGELLTEFVYEGCARVGVVDGLMAVQQHGKWGYVRDDGTMITEFIYDAVASDDYWGDELYAPVNGYIVVCQEKGWGLIDTDGNTVIEPRYEGITQVDDQGRFWFKQNGTWSAAKLNR